MPKLPTGWVRAWPSMKPPAALDGGLSERWVLPALVVYGLIVATYFVVRSGGRWAEVDTTNQTNAIRGLARGGTLALSEDLYGNGFGYTLISNALLVFTGVDVLALQQVIYPFVSVLLIPLAWVLYRELTGSQKAAALATLFLSMQPEFVFVMLRGSHERILRLSMLLGLWLLVRSFRLQDRPGAFAVHVVLFYLASFAVLATNTIFGMSFIAALVTAMLVAWVCGHQRSHMLALGKSVASRLALAGVAAGTLGFIVMFYVYPYAGQSLRAFKDMIQVVVALLATTSSGTNPYGQVVEGWVSLWVYFLVSAADYLLIAGAAAVWLWQGASWLRGRTYPETLAAWLVWLLCGAFALQGALGIVADRSGLLGANLQHRSFPSFAIIAMPLVASALCRWQPGRWGMVAATALVTALAILALPKATNEPVLANKWTFYTPAELDALQWADVHWQEGGVWVGSDERLREAFGMEVGKRSSRVEWDIYTAEATTRTFVISNVIELQAARQGRPLPNVAVANRVYDNGSASIYRVRPSTPYQR